MTSRILTPAEIRRVIFASSLGTVFEWYDFYLYGSLAAIISKQFFSGVNETAAFIFALMAFAAGFAVRPFGALVFGRLGDLVGRKYTFLISILLLGASVWIRLSLNESPVFQKMKEEGKQSKAPLTESFGQWKNLKIVILALLGLTAGQAVVWYTGQFYALFFLTQTLKVDAASANILIALSLAIGTPFFILFGWLSDKIGRKPIIMAGCLIAALTYFPLFKGLTHYANPQLEQALVAAPVTVTADPGECSFQFNPVGTSKFTSSCDIAKSFLARNSVAYTNIEAP